MYQRRSTAWPIAVCIGIACDGSPSLAPPRSPAPRSIQVVDERVPARGTAHPSARSSNLPIDDPLPPPSPVGPEVALHESPLRIQQPPGTSLHHEWKAGHGVDWVRFDGGAHEGEAIYVRVLTLAEGATVDDEVQRLVAGSRITDNSTLSRSVRGGVGVVETRYTFDEALDCRRETPGCNRTVVVVTKVGAALVACTVTDYGAVDDWARRTALDVCRTIVPR